MERPVSQENGVDTMSPVEKQAQKKPHPGRGLAHGRGCAQTRVHLTITHEPPRPLPPSSAQGSPSGAGLGGPWCAWGRSPHPRSDSPRPARGQGARALWLPSESSAAGELHFHNQIVKCSFKREARDVCLSLPSAVPLLWAVPACWLPGPRPHP